MHIKTLMPVAIAAMTAFASASAVFAQQLPDSGTYFIINVDSGEAIQPVGPTVAQNVLLYPFTKSGMQKWDLKRQIDPITKKPTNRYSITLAGNPGLILEPHPVVMDHTALIGTDANTFALDATPAGTIMKSVARNGDAMFVFPYPPLPSEARFGPNDGSAKFLWKLDPTD